MDEQEQNAIIQEIDGINRDRADLRRQNTEKDKIIIELQERNQALENAILDASADLKGAIE